ncbi:30S ribosomal protein S11, partial [Stenotrophomonas sp. A3_2]|uniref:30S ribosomal protein S11 n=1 Tax=Stenotrophomonas sp. A3_2 TaxID=3119978 RepID=UPI002FC36EA3
KARDHGMETVEVFISGPGSGRETAIRSINNNGLAVQSIRDVTAVPHNGCRPPKAPRN